VVRWQGYRAAPAWPEECCWIVRNHLLCAWTPTRDWRVQIGFSRDDAGCVIVVSLGCLHLGWYFLGARQEKEGKR
jgi:hypothetical protein